MARMLYCKIPIISAGFISVKKDFDFWRGLLSGKHMKITARLILGKKVGFARHQHDKKR